MIDERYIELMHYEIDGIITEEDRHSLRQYLTENPEAETLFSELAAVAKTLAEVQPVDPSPNLKKRIINSIPQNLYAMREDKRSTSWLHFLEARPKLGFSFTFAAGLACGLALLVLLSGQPSLNNRDLIGTMQSHDSRGNFGEIAKIDVVEDQFSISLQLKRSERLVLAVMDVSALSELNFVLAFDSADLQFSGFQRDEAKVAGLSMASGEISLTQVGRNKYVFAFSDLTRASTDITLKVLDSEVIYQTSLSSGVWNR